MKKNINITVDLDAYQTALDMGINLSEACNKGLREAAMLSDPKFSAEVLRREAQDLENKAELIENRNEDIKLTIEDNLKNFDELKKKILENESALMYWARITKKPVNELIERKKRQIGLIE